MKPKKHIGILIGLVFLFVITGTFAWTSISQQVLNEKSGKSGPAGGRIHDDYQQNPPVYSNESNKDVYAENYGEQALIVRVKLSEYYEEDMKPLVTGTKKEDRQTWIPYRSMDSKFYRTYTEWVFGGDKVYLPTFNDNPNSKETDATGDAIDFVTDGQTALGDGSQTYFNLNQAVTNPKDLSEQHTTVQTLKESRTVITMEAWKQLTPSQQIGAYWILDTDGWAYWAQLLASKSATSLLLTGVKWNQSKLADGSKWYYGIDVIGEFSTVSDKNNLKESPNGSPSSDGHTLLEMISSGALIVKDTVMYTSDAAWQPEDNFVSGTDRDGNALSLSQVKVAGSVTMGQPGTYSIKYSYNGVSKTATVIVKGDKSSLVVKNLTLYKSDAAWQPEDNFVSGTDRDGNALSLSQVKVAGSVTMSQPGTYSIKYSYNGMSKIATVTVKWDKSSLTVNNSTIYSKEPSWRPQDNFVNATDRDGNSVSYANKIVSVDGKVTMSPGTYIIMYNYRDYPGSTTIKKKSVTVTVLEGVNFAKWMKSVPDTVHLNQLSIPGTHDTMAYKQRGSLAPSNTWKTQKYTLAQQLQAGTRFLDLRVASDLSMHHGIVDLNSYLDGEVLREMKVFLTYNPSEFILVRVKHEDGNRNNFNKSISTFIENNKEIFYKYNGKNPQVKELRGKVVVLDNTPDNLFYNKGYAVDWWGHNSTTRIQDNYDNPSYDNKEDYIKNLIQESNNLANDKLYLNHVSATGNIVGMVLGIKTPEKYANHLKPRITDFLKSYQPQRSGVIIYDFTAEWVAQPVIESNYRYVEHHR